MIINDSLDYIDEETNSLIESIHINRREISEIKICTAKAEHSSIINEDIKLLESALVDFFKAILKKIKNLAARVASFFSRILDNITKSMRDRKKFVEENELEEFEGDEIKMSAHSGVEMNPNYAERPEEAIDKHAQYLNSISLWAKTYSEGIDDWTRLRKNPGEEKIPEKEFWEDASDFVLDIRRTALNSEEYRELYEKDCRGGEKNKYPLDSEAVRLMAREIKQAEKMKENFEEIKKAVKKGLDSSINRAEEGKKIAQDANNNNKVTRLSKEVENYKTASEISLKQISIGAREMEITYKQMEKYCREAKNFDKRNI